MRRAAVAVVPRLSRSRVTPPRSAQQLTKTFDYKPVDGIQDIQLASTR